MLASISLWITFQQTYLLFPEKCRYYSWLPSEWIRQLPPGYPLNLLAATSMKHPHRFAAWSNSQIRPSYMKKYNYPPSKNISRRCTTTALSTHAKAMAKITTQIQFLTTPLEFLSNLVSRLLFSIAMAYTFHNDIYTPDTLSMFHAQVVCVYIAHDKRYGNPCILKRIFNSCSILSLDQDQILWEIFRYGWIWWIWMFLLVPEKYMGLFFCISITSFWNPLSLVLLFLFFSIRHNL